jgi:hypothetical protein
VSGTHDLREDPLMTIPHEEHSEFPRFEEIFDTKGFRCALIFHCREHEAFILSLGLAIEEVVKKIPCAIRHVSICTG